MDDIATAAEQALSSTAESAADDADRNDIFPALARLDRLLEQAVASATATYGRETAGDRFRGLYVGTGEVERLLARAPGTSPLWTAPVTADMRTERNDGSSRLSWLANAYGLSSAEVDIALIALAPEVDLRYERLYAFLQDDVSRRRPSVDLALNLLCRSAEDKVAGRAWFSPEAPLVRRRVLRLVPDAHQPAPPLLGHSIRLDEQIVRLLLYERGMDARLQSFCKWIEPDPIFIQGAAAHETDSGIRNLVVNARNTREPLCLYLYGPHSPDKQRWAQAISAHTAAPLLAADLDRAAAMETDFAEIMQVLFREAWFQDALLYLHGLDALRANASRSYFEDLVAAIPEAQGITIMSGTMPWYTSAPHPLDVVVVPLQGPGFAARCTEWQTHLEARGGAIDQLTLHALADRFRFNHVQIAAAVSAGCSRAQLRAASETGSMASAAASALQGTRRAPAHFPTEDDLFAGARAQCGDSLAALAHRIAPKYTWGDLVLPSDSMAQLRELCQRVAHRHRVLGDWGFDRKLSLGKGVNALFAGPPGTGKTMAAEIIASELRLDLYRIDLAGIVSKYIGETEKNLDRVFSAAESANAILFFDEADALFGKRSEVRDSHDRYANIEISYLLQKMEECDGIAILATNLRQNLDDAFTRRLAYTVHFPFPDEESRRRIWEGIWPAETPRGTDVDLDFMARQFKLSGGHIKNIVLASAFLAAQEQLPVTMAHLIHATRREHQKMGKTLIEPGGSGTDRYSAAVAPLASETRVA